MHTRRTVEKLQRGILGGLALAALLCGCDVMGGGPSVAPPSNAAIPTPGPDGHAERDSVAYGFSGELRSKSERRRHSLISAARLPVPKALSSRDTVLRIVCGERPRSAAMSAVDRPS